MTKGDASVDAVLVACKDTGQPVIEYGTEPHNSVEIKWKEN